MNCCEHGSNSQAMDKLKLTWAEFATLS